MVLGRIIGNNRYLSTLVLCFITQVITETLEHFCCFLRRWGHVQSGKSLRKMLSGVTKKCSGVGTRGDSWEGELAASSEKPLPVYSWGPTGDWEEPAGAQRRDRVSGVPLEILEHLPPKPESAYFLLCAFPYPSYFMGGCPPLPLSEKRVSLQLQLIIPGCDSVSTYKLLWKSSSLPEWVFPATCDCSEPANCERQEMF